uniref:DNA2/NAM7 helicase helicase domain-containing protein n=1 Tax=Oryza punctata TaxID=4537 RepID=A0A0E0JT43_ORYPU
MPHSDKACKPLFQEVLSWSVSDILKGKQCPFKVEMIPDEFETWADYTKAFRNPTLVEIWHQINLGMDTISGGLYVDCYEDKQDSRWPNRYNILVIDEAANLKECDSIIPLTIDGIKHVVLVGDDNQLQSVVVSPIAEEAKYGRSLFERLYQIGYHKHLLNLQYRMHHSISKFPIANFYDGEIENCSSGHDNLGNLLGHMFFNYSFINVEDGIEEQIGRSTKNMVEVVLAANIVARVAEADP